MTETAFRRHENWWRAPMISTLVTGLCLPIARGLRGLAEMATDPCDGPGSCPTTYAQLAFAEHLLQAVLVLVVVQWPVAYFASPARVWAALTPGATLGLAVLTMVGTHPGA
ncbi:hypothetical protein OG535_03330 [Kitasatospora sp. NBC_00085]|uniref:hypothetical protein n=1 Tax=unclassified Kitasatospora TaxID=2633591 RepID=UPI002F90755E